MSSQLLRSVSRVGQKVNVLGHKVSFLMVFGFII